MPLESRVVAGMAALPWFRVEHIIWYGGEIDLQARPDGFDALVLVDVEAGISADVSIGSVDIVSIDRKNPLIVRYKAIGFIIGNKAGESKFPFRPYFDSSKGYTIDVSKPGAIQVHDPFDKILKILGARLSRNNPFYVEVDLGFAVDLGVVSIEPRACAAQPEPGRSRRRSPRSAQASTFPARCKAADTPRLGPTRRGTRSSPARWTSPSRQ